MRAKTEPEMVNKQNRSRKKLLGGYGHDKHKKMEERPTEKQKGVLTVEQQTELCFVHDYENHY